MKQKQYEYIVVGTGPGGAPVALEIRLRRRGFLRDQAGGAVLAAPAHPIAPE